MIKCDINNSEMATINVDGTRENLCKELTIIVAKLIEKDVLYEKDKYVLVKLLTSSSELATDFLKILREG